MKMFLRTLLPLIVLMSCTVIAQPTGDSLDYFPYRAGDTWRLRTYDIPEYPPDTYIVLRDSVDSVGNIFLFLNTPMWNSNTGEVKIDTAGNVYNDPRSTYPNLLYRLRAKQGDTWRLSDEDSFSLKIYVTCGESGPTNYFGKLSTGKAFYYWYYWPSTGDSVWLSTRWLFRGLGEITQVYEPNASYELSGAIINGQAYGEMIPGEVRASSGTSPLRIAPNPFIAEATISYQLDSRQHIRLTLSDVLGRIIATPVDEVQDAGEHITSIDGTNLPNGAYFYHLRTPTHTISGTLIRRR